MSLLLCAAISLLTGLLLGTMFGAVPQMLIFSAILLGIAYFLGEYVLVLLIHLSQEGHDLNERVSQLLGNIDYGTSGLENQTWRIFVADDDAQLITALGRRTLVVTRGCFNMRNGEFRCALQEAIEQRISGRSTALLLATVGNPFFFVARVFCRIGRLLLGILMFPITLIISIAAGGNANSFRGGYEAGQRVSGVTNSITDWVYGVFSWLLIHGSNLMVLAYTPVIRPMDAAIDRRLLSLNLRGVLTQVINDNAQVVYRGRFARENCIILRTPAERRLAQINEPVQALDDNRQVTTGNGGFPGLTDMPRHPGMPQNPPGSRSPAVSQPPATQQSNPSGKRIRIVRGDGQQEQGSGSGNQQPRHTMRIIR